VRIGLTASGAAREGRPQPSLRHGPRLDSAVVDEAEARTRLAALGFAAPEVETLAAHFADAERTGREGHGFRRIEWLETWPSLAPEARPDRAVSEPGYERWDGNGALGYLVLDAVVEAQLADPPTHARLVVAGRTFPTGVLGHWTRRLAEGGLVAALTATSPRRLGPPGGGPKLAGTNPLSIAIPSSDGSPVVADVSMGNATYGDVLAGRLAEEELAPFGGEHAHKAFALAVGLELLVAAVTPDDGFGAVLLVARPEADPVPALRALAAGARLPGDRA
jgi:malate/lactate dehydrogenase-like protein